MQPFTPGWNDPPSMKASCSPSSSSSSSVRNLLNKRVAFPLAPNAGQVQSPSLNSPATGLSPVPPSIAAAPSDSSLDGVPDKKHFDNSQVQAEPVEDCTYANDEVMDILRSALAACSSTPATNVENITKRLEKLQAALDQSSVSQLCRQKLCSLVKAIKEKRYADAYNFHSAMMVEHFAEVNPWMVGVKALILESQKQGA